jgi:putative transposase
MMHKSMWYYKSKKDDAELMSQLQSLAESHPSRGLDEFVGRLRGKGCRWNRKRIYRVYKLLNLHKRKRIKKRLPSRDPLPLSVPIAPRICWSMDFMSDALTNGRKIRILNIIDDFNREALCIEAQYSYPTAFVIRTLERLEVEIGLPKRVRVDNGPEFISNTFQQYCSDKRIEIEYIKPGKPMQNGYIERFNRHYREDILDAYLFENIKQIRDLTDEWRLDYNDNHPHKSLKSHSPNIFKELFSKGKIYSESVKAKMNGS